MPTDPGAPDNQASRSAAGPPRELPRVRDAAPKVVIPIPKPKPTSGPKAA